MRRLKERRYRAVAVCFTRAAVLRTRADGIVVNGSVFHFVQFLNYYKEKRSRDDPCATQHLSDPHEGLYQRRDDTHSEKNDKDRQHTGHKGFKQTEDMLKTPTHLIMILSGNKGQSLR